MAMTLNQGLRNYQESISHEIGGLSVLKNLGINDLFGKKTDDLIKSAMAVDLGKTIFDGNRGWIGEVMKGAYCVANPVVAVIDLLIKWWNK